MENITRNKQAKKREADLLINVQEHRIRWRLFYVYQINGGINEKEYLIFKTGDSFWYNKELSRERSRAFSKSAFHCKSLIQSLNEAWKF